MAVTCYRHTDASAPVLTGQSGSLIALLDACLINGYSSGGTRKDPPGGWTKAYSGTNKAAYRLNTVGGSGRYLRVKDDLADARSAQIWGYASMSDVDTGLNSFTSIDFFIGKSSTANATARPWMLVADGLFFYLITARASTINTDARCEVCFGDLPDEGEYPHIFTAIAGNIVGGDAGATQASQSALSWSGTSSQVINVASDRRRLYPQLDGLPTSGAGLSAARFAHMASTVSHASGGAGVVSGLGRLTTAESNGVTRRLYPAELAAPDGAGYTRLCAWPGLYFPARWVAGTTFTIETIGGVDYAVVPYSDSAVAAPMFISLANWR